MIINAEDRFAQRRLEIAKQLEAAPEDQSTEENKEMNARISERLNEMLAGM